LTYWPIFPAAERLLDILQAILSAIAVALAIVYVRRAPEPGASAGLLSTAETGHDVEASEPA
jgi:hypothetical protein